MPKKRTVRPFYGKANQELEQHGRALMKLGKVEEAKAAFDESQALLEKRRSATSSSR